MKMNFKAVLLTPKGFGSCEANGVSQGQQGGSGEKTAGAESHAILWSGDASHLASNGGTGGDTLAKGKG